MSRFDDLDGTLGLPDLIEIEPTETCNLRCRMCHVSYLSQQSRTVLDLALIPKLKSLAGRYAILGSAFEPMIHPRFRQLVEKLNSLHFQLELITNGTRIEEETTEVLRAGDLELVTFSFDGIAKETFELIRRRASYEATLEGILKFRDQFRGRATYFAINSTMMRSNIDETEAIIDFWDGQQIDLVRLIFMVIRDLNSELIQESLYPVRSRAFDILDRAALDLIGRHRRVTIRSPYFRVSPLATKYPDNFVGPLVRSDHPDTRIVPTHRQDHQLGAGPGMSFPCRSPFHFARIVANGDVLLCNEVPVGNLHREDFEEVWFGETANRLRRQIQQDDATCRACDYYKFCLQSQHLHLDSPESYLQRDLLRHTDRIDFETGRLRDLPRLIEVIGSYNVVEYDGRFICLPQSAGPIAVDRTDCSQIEGAIVDLSLERARERVSQTLGTRRRDDGHHRVESG